MAYEYQLQLKSAISGKTLTHDGKFMVTVAGAPERVSITDFDDAAITQPGTMVDGSVKFRTAETVASVDVYIRSEFGYYKILSGVKAGQLLEVTIDTSDLYQTLVIPFDIDDAAIVANTEYDTGLDLVTGEQVFPYPTVKVTTSDSGQTIDAGILSGESGGDADGFIDGVSLASAVVAMANVTVTTGLNTKFYAATPTIGALLADHQAGTDVDQDEGLFRAKPYICDGTAKSLSLTLSSSTDTGAGYIRYQTLLPLMVD